MPSPAPCPTPQGCPDPQPCSEVTDAQCVIYTGAEIKCDNRNTIVATNDNLAEALQSIVDYFCTEVTIISDLTCGEDLVVEAGTTVTNAIINVVNYFCNNTPPVQSCPPQVSIVRNNNSNTLTATASGGTGTFTWQWEFSSAVNGISVMYNIDTIGISPTTSNMSFSIIGPTPGIAPAQTANGYDMYIGLAKVIATDTAGCVAKDTYLVIDLLAN